MRRLHVWWPALGHKVYEEHDIPADWETQLRAQNVRFLWEESATDNVALASAFRDLTYNSELGWERPAAESACNAIAACGDTRSALRIMKSYWLGV